MSIDEMCLEKGMSESHKHDTDEVNIAYQMMGCYDCDGRQTDCQNYFSINIHTITDLEIRKKYFGDEK